jgi:hypothetical protein
VIYLSFDNLLLKIVLALPPSMLDRHFAIAIAKLHKTSWHEFFTQAFKIHIAGCSIHIPLQFPTYTINRSTK